MNVADWAGVDHYQLQNSLIPAASSGSERVVFIGDSITFFWNLGSYFPGKSYINRGIERQTTAQMLLRFRQDVLDLHPKLVVILAGINDIGGNAGPEQLSFIEGNLASMAELARQNCIQSLFISVLPVNDLGGHKQIAAHPPDSIRSLNVWISQYARLNREYFVDVYPVLADSHGQLRSDFSEDGLHPNARGYAEIARVLAPAVESAARKMSLYTGSSCRISVR